MGLRLRSVVSDRPKCLAPVGNRAFLDFLLATLEAQRFNRVILCLGYDPEQVPEFVRNRKPGSMNLVHGIEKQALGTAGALRNAEPLVEAGSFLLMNGDTILEVDFDLIIYCHQDRKAAVTLALWWTSVATDRHGTVTLDSKERINGFAEKPCSTTPDARSAHLINDGVYVFNKKVVAGIPSASPPVSLQTEVFLSLIGNGLYGLACDGYFLDIGVPEDYQRAQRELPERFKQC